MRRNESDATTFEGVVRASARGNATELNALNELRRRRQPTVALQVWEGEGGSVAGGRLRPINGGVEVYGEERRRSVSN
jgi:hypothetical protein